MVALCSPYQSGLSHFIELEDHAWVSIDNIPNLLKVISLDQLQELSNISSFERSLRKQGEITHQVYPYLQLVLHDLELFEKVLAEFPKVVPGSLLSQTHLFSVEVVNELVFDSLPLAEFLAMNALPIILEYLSLLLHPLLYFFIAIHINPATSLEDFRRRN